MKSEARERQTVIRDDVPEIDRALRAYPWLDCELRSLRSGGLMIAAGVDLHGPRPDLLLAFDDVLFVCAPTEWRTDTGEAVLSVLCGEEESKIRIAYRIGGEHTIFEMRPEDQEGRFRIAARSIRLLRRRTPERPLRLPVDWSGKSVEVAAVGRDILALLKRNEHLLTSSERQGVVDYVTIGEEEMALEGLCHDLMYWPETSLADLEEMERLGRIVGLDRESVYDTEFWQHFTEILEARRHAR